MSLQQNILDMLARAACWARRERVDRSQVNKLLEVLESTRNVNYVIAFIARQKGRGQIGRNTSKELINVLNTIGNNVDLAREALGIFKWLFEACTIRPDKCVDINFKTFISLVL